MIGPASLAATQQTAIANPLQQDRNPQEVREPEQQNQQSSTSQVQAENTATAQTQETETQNQQSTQQAGSSTDSQERGSIVDLSV